MTPALQQMIEDGVLDEQSYRISMGSKDGRERMRRWVEHYQSSRADDLPTPVMPIHAITPALAQPNRIESKSMDGGVTRGSALRILAVLAVLVMLVRGCS